MRVCVSMYFERVKEEEGVEKQEHALGIKMDFRNTVQMALHSTRGQAPSQSQPPATSSPAVPPSSHPSSITENKGVQRNKKTRENTRAEPCV